MNISFLPFTSLLKLSINQASEAAWVVLMPEIKKLIITITGDKNEYFFYTSIASANFSLFNSCFLLSLSSPGPLIFFFPVYLPMLFSRQSSCHTDNHSPLTL